MPAPAPDQVFGDLTNAFTQNECKLISEAVWKWPWHQLNPDTLTWLIARWWEGFCFNSKRSRLVRTFREESRLFWQQISLRLDDSFTPIIKILFCSAIMSLRSNANKQDSGESSDSGTWIMTDLQLVYLHIWTQSRGWKTSPNQLQMSSHKGSRLHKYVCLTF